MNASDLFEAFVESARHEFEPPKLQTPACDRCTQGVMDATNDHLRGLCKCECHEERIAA